VQMDGPAGGCHDLRDSAPHLAGSDDEHALESHRGRTLAGTQTALIEG
jgi:hypothetical protein